MLSNGDFLFLPCRPKEACCCWFHDLDFWPFNCGTTKDSKRNLWRMLQTDGQGAMRIA